MDTDASGSQTTNTQHSRTVYWPLALCSKTHMLSIVQHAFSIICTEHQRLVKSRRADINKGRSSSGGPVLVDTDER